MGFLLGTRISCDVDSCEPIFQLDGDELSDEIKPGSFDAAKWIERITVSGAAISGLLGKLFPQMGARGQTLAYALAVVLFLCSTIIFYFRQRRSIPRPSTTKDTAVATGAILRGLLPFDEGDTLLARGSDVLTILTLLKSKGFRFGVVWGESGCGKTSLLRAGLVPMLRKQNIPLLYLPKPTGDPVQSLESSIGDTKTESSSIDAQNPSPSANGIIIIDQFEELFLFNPTRDDAQKFREWLGTMKVRSAQFSAVLLGIREDFFAKLSYLSPTIPDPTSSRCTYELENLRVEQAKQILAASAVEDDVPFDDGLITRLIDHLNTAGRVRTAELQLVATELKRKRLTKASEYDALGGATGILASYVEKEIKLSGNPSLV